MALVNVYAGFEVEFKHDDLTYFPHQTPGSEFMVRKTYFDALVGTKADAFKSLFTGPFTTVSDTAQLRGHIGGTKTYQVALNAIAAYNNLSAGLTFGDPPPEPHCVVHVWIDGELVTFYNWLTPIEQVNGDPPPPGGMYHVVVSTRDTDVT